MKRSLLVAAVLLIFTGANSKAAVTKNAVSLHSVPIRLKGNQFTLLYQVFESHDSAGTQIDTVHHDGDIILFAINGTAYMHYQNKSDSIGYAMIQSDSLSFGDTPFRIIKIDSENYKLYQNEEMKDGSYNRVVYVLTKNRYQL